MIITFPGDGCENNLAERQEAKQCLICLTLMLTLWKANNSAKRLDPAGMNN